MDMGVTLSGVAFCANTDAETLSNTANATPAKDNRMVGTHKEVVEKKQTATTRL